MATYFKNPVYNFGESMPELTLDRIRAVAALNKRTELVLDANIVIAISEYMIGRKAPDFEKLRKRNLDTLVEIMHTCNANKLPFGITPGLSLDEVFPRDGLDAAIYRYHSFFTMHGLFLYDDEPTRTYQHPDQPRDVWKLDEHKRQIRSVAYLSFLALLIVFNDKSIENWTQRFIRYLDLIREYAGIYSQKEMLIAQLVLGDFQKERELRGAANQLCKAMRENFAQIPKDEPINSTVFKGVASNGSSDIALINNLLMVSDNHSPGEEHREHWLVTHDSKLASLIDCLQYPPLGAGDTGAAVLITLPAPLMDHPKFKVMNGILRSYKNENRPFSKITSEIWQVRMRALEELAESIYPTSETTVLA